MHNYSYQHGLKFRRQPKLIDATLPPPSELSRLSPTQGSNLLNFSKTQIQQATCLTQFSRGKVEVASNSSWSNALTSNPFNQFSQEDFCVVFGMVMLSVIGNPIQHPDRNPNISNHQPRYLKPGCVVCMGSKIVWERPSWIGTQKHHT
jgi:hypothetical protein